MGRVVMVLKRLIRPLIPDRIMARYRLHQHSRQVRSNVDVLVGSNRELRRWLRSTPDTYRIGLASDVPDAIGSDGMPGRGTAADVVVTADVIRPRLVGRRRVEPTLRAVTVRVTANALKDIAEAPPDPVARHRSLTDAGHRVLLVPRVVAAVDPHRHDPIDRPVVVVLAAVPLHDVGGGSRGAQIATEFLRRGFHVIYVALHGTHESVDLGLRFIHPHLEQYRLDEFDLIAVAARTRPGVVLVEIPAPVLVGPVRELARLGWRLVYDLIDLWSDPALGGDWFRADTEHWLLTTAELVTASAPDLIDHAAANGVAALSVPNGVNPALFAGTPGDWPDDLPKGSPVLGYHGSLYGDWFDWGAVISLATAEPHAAVVLVGDRPSRIPSLPDNVHLLGLKPQGAMLDYVSRFEVGLLPFVVSATTHAVSPLKVFEYLATGVPVAAPPLRSLEGVAGVATAPDLVTAVAAARRLSRPDRTAALLAHSWEERVQRMVSALAIPDPTPGPTVRVVVRPPVHYSRRQRRL